MEVWLIGMELCYLHAGIVSENLLLIPATYNIFLSYYYRLGLKGEHGMIRLRNGL